MEGVKIEKLSPTFSDERGVITDILSGDMQNLGIITKRRDKGSYEDDTFKIELVK